MFNGKKYKFEAMIEYEKLFKLFEEGDQSQSYKDPCERCWSCC